MNSPPSSAANKSTGFHDLMIALAALAVVAYLEVVIFYWCHPLIIGHDQALHLECAKLMVRGAAPYVGFLDTNPPLIFYLDAIPAALSNWFATPPPFVFSEWIVLLSLLSFLGSLALVKEYLLSPEFSSAAAVLIALIFLNLFFRFDFGQREHIFVLFYTPFLLLRWLRWHDKNTGWSASIFTGIVAAIGTCLKPFFLLPVLAIELFWLIEMRRLKPLLAPEISAFAFTLFAYLIHFFFLPEASQKEFFGVIVPALKEGYGFYDITTIAQLGLAQFKQIFTAGALVCFVALLLRSRSSLLMPLAAFTIASLPIYLLQNKGWAYHGMSFFAGGLYLLSLELWIILEECGRFWNSYQMKVSAVVCSIVLLGWYFGGEMISYLSETKIPLEVLGWKGTSPRADIAAPDISNIVLLRSSPGDSILFFSNGVWPQFPLTVQLNREPGSRHMHLSLFSMLEFVRASNEQSSLLKYEKQMIDEYAIDINANKPKLVFVQITPVEDYLRPFEFEQKYLSDYARLGDVEGFRVYTRRGS